MIQLTGNSITIPQGESGSIKFFFKNQETNDPYILKSDENVYTFLIFSVKESINNKQNVVIEKKYYINKKLDIVNTTTGDYSGIVTFDESDITKVEVDSTKYPQGYTMFDWLYDNLTDYYHYLDPEDWYHETNFEDKDLETIYGNAKKVFKIVLKDNNNAYTYRYYTIEFEYAENDDGELEATGYFNVTDHEYKLDNTYLEVQLDRRDTVDKQPKKYSAEIARVDVRTIDGNYNYKEEDILLKETLLQPIDFIIKGAIV
jgi:hypothetical protein